MVRPKYRALVLIVVLLGLVILAPFLTGSAARAWIWCMGRQSHLAIHVDKIDAPFLRPVLLSGIHITSLPGASSRLNLDAKQISLTLNFKRLILRSRDRAVRNISVSDLRLELRRDGKGNAIPEGAWSTWQKLLPDTANLIRAQIRVESGPTVVIMRGGTFSIAEIESGRFAVDEFTVASPFVRQTFSGLRGATQWQGNRLTLAGVMLTRGLDLQSLSIDLAHLSKERVDLDFEIDAVGGRLRGNVSDEWRPQHSNWTIAATAADISLTQTAEAVGLADRVAGRLRSAKFTYRGSPDDPTQATASLWCEIAAPAWRNREADVVMLGASFYNRQVEVQQLYIKQRRNSLTLNGTAPLPNNWSDWIKSDFRATISAAIDDVADFASLFGGKWDDFGGQLAIDGTIDSHNHKVDGDISARGKSLRFFGSPVDLFNLRLNIAAGVADISDFQLQRKDDSLKVQGKIDLLGQQGLKGTLELGIHNLAEYLPGLLPAASLRGRLDFYGRSATFDGAEFGNGANTVAVSGSADFTDPSNIHVTLRPLSPVVEITPPIAGNCINGLEIDPVPANTATARIDRAELQGSLFTGLREIKIQTESIEENYQVGCKGSRPLPIALPTRPE